eukprot:scaffold7735_cov248-Pinguiococcus_pyrenoidosus.AAC.4
MVSNAAPASLLSHSSATGTSFLALEGVSWTVWRSRSEISGVSMVTCALQRRTNGGVLGERRSPSDFIGCLGESADHTAV